MTRKSLGVLIAAYATGIGASGQVAAMSLDQFQLDGSGQNQALHSLRTVGQTFTAGATGRLNAIELSVAESGVGGDLTMEVLDMAGGDPGAAPVLGMLSIPETEIGPFPTILDPSSVTGTLIDLTSLDIFVGQGDLLGFRLSSVRVLPNLYTLRTSTNPASYTDGSLFIGSNLVDGSAGRHGLSVTLELSDGSTVSDTITWTVEENTEP